MASIIDTLTASFAKKVKTLLANCEARGIIMKPTDGIRTPLQQAKIWRQSRSAATVTKKIKELKEAKAEYLAKCIEDAGPQSGPEVTNAIPGYSWHQYGEAVDCVWIVNGKPLYDLKKTIEIIIDPKTQKKVNLNGFSVYAEEAAKLGLTPGLYWRKPDAPHVQLRPEGSPGDLYSVLEINKSMKSKFDKK